MIRKMRIDAVDLDGEGAVDLAFFKLSRAASLGAIRPNTRSDEFSKLMRVFLKRVVTDQKKRSCAAKRVGVDARAAGQVRRRVDVAIDPQPIHIVSLHRVEIDLDTIRSRERSTEEIVVVELELKSISRTLPDDIHRSILKMRWEGYTIVEIACRLGLARNTIARKMKDIGRHYQKSSLEV